MQADEAVIAHTARLVTAARGLVDDYAGPGAPVSADQLRVLLGASGCHVEIFPFRSDALGMTLPCVRGVHPVLVNEEGGVELRLALRHQLAHVLSGEARGSVCLAGEGMLRPAERAADLFALADAVPGWWVAGVVRTQPSLRGAADVLALRVAELAERWRIERVNDRVELRLKLFCDHGI